MAVALDAGRVEAFVEGIAMAADVPERALLVRNRVTRPFSVGLREGRWADGEGTASGGEASHLEHLQPRLARKSRLALVECEETVRPQNIRGCDMQEV